MLSSAQTAQQSVLCGIESGTGKCGPLFVPCAQINVCATTRKVNKACLAQVKPRDVLWFLVECRVLLATGPPVCLSCSHYSHLAGLSTLFFTISRTAQTLNCCQCQSDLGFNSQHRLKAAFIPNLRLRQRRAGRQGCTAGASHTIHLMTEPHKSIWTRDRMNEGHVKKKNKRPKS